MTQNVPQPSQHKSHGGPADLRSGLGVGEPAQPVAALLSRGDPAAGEGSPKEAQQDLLEGEMRETVCDICYVEVFFLEVCS